MFKIVLGCTSKFSLLINLLVDQFHLTVVTAIKPSVGATIPLLYQLIL